jgi:filamentous hemagglutinin
VLKIETGTLDNSTAGLIVGNGEADVAVAGRLDNSVAVRSQQAAGHA